MDRTWRLPRRSRSWRGGLFKPFRPGRNEQEGSGSKRGDDERPKNQQRLQHRRVCSRRGGWPTPSRYPVDERARLDDTTPVRQPRVTGLAFSGGRPFRFQKGRGFGVLSIPWPTNSFASTGAANFTSSHSAVSSIQLQFNRVKTNRAIQFQNSSLKCFPAARKNKLFTNRFCLSFQHGLNSYVAPRAISLSRAGLMEDRLRCS